MHRNTEGFNIAAPSTDKILNHTYTFFGYATVPIATFKQIYEIFLTNIC